MKFSISFVEQVRARDNIPGWGGRADLGLGLRYKDCLPAGVF